MKLNNVVISAESRPHIVEALNIGMAEGDFSNLFSIWLWNFVIEQNFHRALTDHERAAQDEKSNDQADDGIDHRPARPGGQYYRQADAEVHDQVRLVVNGIGFNRQ